MIHGIRLLSRKSFAIGVSRRLCSSDSNYVNRVRQFDFWQQSEIAIEMEFERGHFMLMVDKEPLIIRPPTSSTSYQPDLAICGYEGRCKSCGFIVFIIVFQNSRPNYKIMGWKLAF